MDLFRALPALRHHPLLSGKRVALVGISTIVHDGAACYFEIGKPTYWQRRQDGATVVGIGGIGGAIERDETILACLRREAREELGVSLRLEMPNHTYLIHDWRVADALDLPAGKKRPTPLMVILIPPRLGGPDIPHHLAIASYRTRARGTPVPRDLFGLLRIENQALSAFFARDEWPLEETAAHPGLTVTLNGPPPDNAILRPVLSARAFQLLVRAGIPCAVGTLR